MTEPNLDQAIQDLYDKAMPDWTPEKQRANLAAGFARKQNDEARDSCMAGKSMTEAYRVGLSAVKPRTLLP